MIVAALLGRSSSARRGAAAALAGLTKFAPLALGPLFCGVGARRASARWSRLRLAYASAAVAMLPVLLDDNLHAFWHDTDPYQAAVVAVLGLGPVGWPRFRAAPGRRARRRRWRAVALLARGQRTVVEVAALGRPS